MVVCARRPCPHRRRQIALAIRDEVLDLENAGIRVIQIDEPASAKACLPKRADWDTYLD